MFRPLAIIRSNNFLRSVSITSGAHTFECYYLAYINVDHQLTHWVRRLDQSGLCLVKFYHWLSMNDALSESALSWKDLAISSTVEENHKNDIIRKDTKKITRIRLESGN